MKRVKRLSADWVYSHGPRTICKGCGKSTRGYLEKDGWKKLISCCPHCRDTHSKFEELTGVDRSTVFVKSERSTATDVNIPAEDQLPPMLARAMKNVKPDSLKGTILVSPEWVACEKIDGVRAVAHITKEGIFFLSRNKSKGTGLYNDLTGRVPHLQISEAECQRLAGTVLDGELIFTGDVLNTGKRDITHKLNATVALTNSAPEKSVRLQEQFGMLEYIVFDVLKVRGRDVRRYDFKFRSELRAKILDHFPNRWYSIERSVAGSSEVKEAFYQEIIQAGGEGIMYKDISSAYCTKASSRPSSWVKRKVQHTVDGFITGFTPGEHGFKGLVGALEVSVYDGDNEIPVAMVSALELELRKEMTTEEGTLKDEYYKQVVEVSFQELTARAKRGRHAVLNRFRPEKHANDCTMKSMALS